MRVPDWYLRKFGWIPRPVRRIIVLVIGGTFLLLSLLGILLPVMPGWIFLPLALAILAMEFAWAARWLLKIRRTANGAFNATEKSAWPARYLTRAKVACVSCWHRLRGRAVEVDAFGRKIIRPSTRPAVPVPRPRLSKTTEPTAPTG